MIARRLPALLAALLVALVGGVLAAAPASAHAQVVSSSPSNGERLDQAPSSLEFVLSEPVDPATAVIALTGPDGPVQALGAPSQSDVPGGSASTGRAVLTVPVTASLPDGLYRISLRATSLTDGHTTWSHLVFGVRADVVERAPADVAEVSLLDSTRSAAEGIVLIAAGIAFGAALLARAVPRPTRRLATVAASVSLAAAAVGGLLYHERAGVLVALGGIAGSVLLLLLARRGDAARAPQLAAALAMASAPLALIGHAAAQGPVPTAIAAVHLTTTSAWIGVVIAGAVLTARASFDRRPALSVVSRVGGATFLLSVVTGLLLSDQVIPSVAGVVSSAYGQGLALKAGLVLVLLLLALVARMRLHRDRSTSLVPEALVMLGIAGLAIAVSTMPPPQSARYLPTPAWTADSGPVAVSADDLFIAATIDPNVPGSRFLVVHVTDTRRPAPAEVTAVQAAWDNGTPVPLVKGEDGAWSARLHVVSDGPHTLGITAVRPGLDDAVGTTEWTVAPIPGTREGGATLTPLVVAAIAVLVAASLLGVVLEYVLAGARRREDDDADDADSDGRGPGGQREPVLQS